LLTTLLAVTDLLVDFFTDCDFLCIEALSERLLDDLIICFGVASDVSLSLKEVRRMDEVDLIRFVILY